MIIVLIINYAHWGAIKGTPYTGTPKEPHCGATQDSQQVETICK